jgi:hypothetical protein
MASLLMIGVLGSSSGDKPRGKPGWSQPPIGTAYINGLASRGIETVHVHVARLSRLRGTIACQWST